MPQNTVDPPVWMSIRTSVFACSTFSGAPEITTGQKAASSFPRLSTLIQQEVSWRLAGARDPT